MTHYYQAKAPNEVLDYSLDWSDFLTGGERITSSTWAVNPTGLTTSYSSNTTAATTITLSSGSHGETYYCKNTIVTDGSPNRTGVRTVILKVWSPIL